LQADRASLGAGDAHRLEPLFGNFPGFFKDFLGANFQADIASLAPFLVQANDRGLFRLSGAFFQVPLSLRLFLNPFLERILKYYPSGRKRTSSFFCRNALPEVPPPSPESSARDLQNQAPPLARSRIRVISRFRRGGIS
jgi:hypothetical protein